MPASSLYCCHRSVSISSAAARKRRMAASPLVRPLLARAADASAKSPPAPIAAPATAPLTKSERRVVPSAWIDCCSMVSSYSSAVEQRSTCLPSQGGGALNECYGPHAPWVHDAGSVFGPRWPGPTRWVVDREAGGPLEHALDDAIPRWLEQAWAFRSVHYSP